MCFVLNCYFVLSTSFIGCTPHRSLPFECKSLQLLGLFGSKLLISTRDLFFDGRVVAAAIIFQAVDGPGTSSWHEVVLRTRLHSPEHEGEDSFEEQKEGAEWYPGHRTRYGCPAEEPDVCDLVSLLVSFFDINRHLVSSPVFSQPVGCALCVFCTTANVNSRPLAGFLKDKHVHSPNARERFLQSLEIGNGRWSCRSEDI